MSNRYYIGNPRTILRPDAYAHIFTVNSWQAQTTRLRKLTDYHDSRAAQVPKDARTNTLIPIPDSASHLVNMIRDTYHTETHLIFVPAIDSVTVDDPTAICFEVPDDLFAFVGFSGRNPLTVNFTITLHLSFHGRVFATPDTKLMKGLRK